MSRALSPEFIALIKANKVRPALFVYGDFPSGAVRVWSGVHSIVRLGETWVGAGNLLEISGVEETIDTGGNMGMRVKVSGIDSDFVTKLQNDDYQHREAYVLLAFEDPATGDHVFMDEPLWKGTMDTDEAEGDKEKKSLAIKGEHRLMDILRKREWKYTQADQDALYPDDGSTGFVRDTGLSHMEELQDAKIPWGRAQK